MARQTLGNNVKFKSLVRKLQLPRPYVRGLLETMWDVAHECGNPILGSPVDVEDAAEWPGKRLSFFKSVKDLRLIDELENGQWAIHDYWHHAPEYVKGRKRKEEERKRNSDKLHPNTAIYSRKNDSSSDKDLRSKSPGHSGTFPESPAVSATPAPAPAPAPLSGTNLPDPAKAGTVAPPIPKADPASGSSARLGKRRRGATRPQRPEHNAVRDYFCERWSETCGENGAPYAWKHGQHGDVLKWVLDQLERDVDAAKRVIDLFLADDDAWLVDKGHAFEWIRNRFDRYRAKRGAAGGSAKDDWTSLAYESPPLTEAQLAAVHQPIDEEFRDE